MNCNILKFFPQNVRKNKLIVGTILKTQFSYDIIFIQEPSWSIICTIPSSNSCEGEVLVGMPHHPTGSLLPGSHQISQISQESWLISTFVFYLCISLFEMTSLITETFSSFPFSITMFVLIL